MKLSEQGSAGDGNMDARVHPQTELWLAVRALRWSGLHLNEYRIIARERVHWSAAD